MKSVYEQLVESAYQAQKLDPSLIIILNNFSGYFIGYLTIWGTDSLLVVSDSSVLVFRHLNSRLLFHRSRFGLRLLRGRSCTPCRDVKIWIQN